MEPPFQPQCNGYVVNGTAGNQLAEKPESLLLIRQWKSKDILRVAWREVLGFARRRNGSVRRTCFVHMLSRGVFQFSSSTVLVLPFMDDTTTLQDKLLL